MARYNTSIANKTITGATTIVTPDSGAFIQLAGIAPYTVTLPATAAFPGQEFTFHNTTSGTVTLTTPSGAFTGLGGSGTATQAVLPNTVVGIVSDGVNYVTLSEDGSVLFATDATVTGNLTVNTGGTTTTLSPANLTINPSNAGSINNVNIGASTRGSGSFTSLTANSAVTLTANTTSSGTSSGTLVVTGGVGVSGTVHAGAFNGPLTGTLQTAAQPNITSVGGLTVPQIILAPSPPNSAGVIRRSAVSGSNGIRIQGNTTDAFPNDTNAGAYITVGGGVIGDTFEGNIDIVAYGSNVDANRNQIRFSNRSAADTITERMRINKDGLVGIATPSPVATLDVRGGLAVSGWSNNNGGSSGGLEAGWDGTQVVLQSYNRSGNAYTPVAINGSTIKLAPGGSSRLFVNSTGVGINLDSPAARLHVVNSSVSGIGGVPSNTTAILDSSSNNFLLFRNSADNATYSGIAMQDNNVGGYVVFGNAGGAGDQLYAAGYGGVQLQYGTADSINPTARTTVATFNSSGITLNNGNILDNKGYTKLASYDWLWLARRYATGYVSDVRTNINGRFWTESAAPTNEVYLHTNDLSTTTYVGENIWGDVHNYKAWVVTSIFVKRPFTINATLNGDDPYALYINKSYVTGSDGCCTGVAYSYTFTQGWYRIEMVYSESGGGHYVQLGWNPKDYRDYITAMNPFG